LVTIIDIVFGSTPGFCAGIPISVTLLMIKNLLSC
jgi:hypothetical protein